MVRTITIAEGHHRVGIAIIQRQLIPFMVDGVFNGDKQRFGFNIIVGKIVDQIGYDRI